MNNPSPHQIFSENQKKIEERIELLKNMEKSPSQQAEYERITSVYNTSIAIMSMAQQQEKTTSLSNEINQQINSLLNNSTEHKKLSLEDSTKLTKTIDTTLQDIDNIKNNPETKLAQAQLAKTIESVRNVFNNNPDNNNSPKNK